MKKIIYITFFVVQFLTPVSEAKFGHNVPVVAGKVETKDKKGVNLRSCPDISCPIVDGLQEGKIYYFNLIAEGEWLNIKDAYAHRSFIKILNGAFVENKHPGLIKKENVSYNIAKIFIDFGLDKSTKKIVYGEENFIKVTELNHIAPWVQEFKFSHKSNSYRGVFYKQNYYFTDGKRTYCAYYDSRPPRLGIVWNATTKELESQLGDRLHEKRHFYGTRPPKLYAYQLSGECLVDILDEDFDLLKLADYQKSIIDGTDKFVMPEKYAYEQISNTDLGKLKDDVDFGDIYNEDVSAVYKAKHGLKRYFVHFSSPVKKSMVIKKMDPWLVLDITYKKFTVSHSGESLHYKGRLHPWHAIAAHDDMEVNGFKIQKGEVVKFEDLISLIQISNVFKTLRKNIDYGFARTIDQKNFSVGQPLLFFNLSKIKLKTELYKLSPHYVTSLKDFSGQLSLLARIYGDPKTQKIDREYSAANKFINQRMGFVFAELKENGHGYCSETYEGIMYFEKTLKEWDITADMIDSIEYIESEGLYELKFAKAFVVENLELAAKSKLYIQKIPCENAMNMIYAISAQGSKWNKKGLSPSYVRLENLMVLEVINNGKFIYKKHKSNLERALKAGFKKFPLCVKNPLISDNPLKIERCGYYIGDYGSPTFYEIENYNAASNEIVIQGHIYKTTDLIPLVTARLNENEYWLPFVFDLYNFAHNDDNELLNLVKAQQTYTLETDGEGYIKSGAGYYCDPSVGDRHLEPEQRVSRPPFNGTFRILDEAGKLEIKMNEHLTKFYNICEIGC